MAIDMATMIQAAKLGIQADAESLTQSIAPPSPVSAAEGLHDSGGASFADSMKAAVHGVNDQDRAASDKMADVESGRSDDLVGAMVASQEASLSFSMLMQVRNKVMGAVDELIKLPL